MPLSALLGQPRAASLLSGALAGGHVHHAYLFAGPEGVGKTLAALLVARALNCESEAAQAAAVRGAFVDEPCGRCASCHRIAEDPKAHAHPMVMWIDTEARMQAAGLYEPAGERTAAKAIGVRLLRELVIPRVALRVIGGRRKVVVFHDADFTEVAQNAFLKTLEEPPPDTTFILLSSRPDALKVTIRSRCLRVPFGPLPLSVVAARVARERKLSEAEAMLCAAVAGGSMGGALATDPKTLEERRRTILAAELLGPADPLGWLDLAGVLGEKDTAGTALDVLETWYQDVARAAAAELPPQTHTDLAEQARASAQRLGARGAVARIEALRRARTDIERNAQPRLALERAFLSFCGVRPAAPGEPR